MDRCREGEVEGKGLDSPEPEWGRRWERDGTGKGVGGELDRPEGCPGVEGGRGPDHQGFADSTLNSLCLTAAVTLSDGQLRVGSGIRIA